MLRLPGTGLTASEIVLGCMHIAELDASGAERLVKTALDEGINFFDHADIYANGESERVFARAIGMSASTREKVILQSKCGIRKAEGFFDFSKAHILEAVDGILSRLNTEYIDILLLHRPDALMEPEEVAEAFDELEYSGKVRYFGVSNQNPMQIALLQRCVKQKLAFDQLQLSIAHAGMVSQGIYVNMENEGACVRDGSILDFCRLNDITVQAWSPFQKGYFDGVFIGDAQYEKLNERMNAIAQEHNVPVDAIPVAWISRHPARMQTIVGTTKADRLKRICAASEVTLTRAEWYALYKAAGNVLP